MDIRHNEQESRFETTVDGSVAFTEYEMEGADRIVFTHTIVPDELSGRGIAKELVKHALDYAREREMEVVPQCAYVNSFIQRNPEYQDLLAS